MDGAQRQLCYLAAALDRQRFDPVIVLDKEGPCAEELRRLGADVRILKFRKWRSFPDCLLRYWPAMQVAEIGRRENVRLVHTSDVYRSGEMRFVSRLLHIPSLLHIRGPLTAHDVAKHGMKKASAIIPIAERYRQDLLSHGISPRRIELIEDAVDLGRLTRDEAAGEMFRRRFGLDSGLTVGLVGRVEAFKRVREFVDVIAPWHVSRPFRLISWSWARSARRHITKLSRSACGPRAWMARSYLRGARTT